MDKTDKRNLQGGPDFDTTEKGSADERSGAPLETHGPDPDGNDPFVPGAPDVSGGVEPAPLDDKERHMAEMSRRDPMGEDGPSYEAHQGDADPDLGGSTDPNNALEHENSGLRG